LRETRNEWRAGFREFNALELERPIDPSSIHGEGEVDPGLGVESSKEYVRCDTNSEGIFEKNLASFYVEETQKKHNQEAIISTWNGEDQRIGWSWW